MPVDLGLVLFGKLKNVGNYNHSIGIASNECQAWAEIPKSSHLFVSNLLSYGKQKKSIWIFNSNKKYTPAIVGIYMESTVKKHRYFTSKMFLI